MSEPSTAPTPHANQRPSRVLLGVSGGIAAYKAPAIVRAFVGEGHEVQVVMTDSAAAFVSELALTTVSKRPVRRALLDASAEGSVGHIELADWPDVVVVAPATANVMARSAHGLADDLLTTILLATTAPVVWAPAMNTNMWRHPATRRNLEILGERGDTFVGPDRGDLACGWVGEGRMIDPPLIVEGVRRRIAQGRGRPRAPSPPTQAVQSTQVDGTAVAGDAPSARVPWAGRHVLVSAGPTRAYLDPVRFISNASTGSMGFEIAGAARQLGARVTLVSGPVGLEAPEGVERIDVETADQLLEAMDGVLSRESTDLVAMVAAVADLAPANRADHKLDKGSVQGALATMTWRREVDVLATLVQRYANGTKFLGFAAQTVEHEDPAVVEETLLRYGGEKLERKKPHAVFVNRVGVRGLGFSSHTNAGYLMVAREDGAPEVVNSGDPVKKAVLAHWLLDQIGRLVLGPVNTEGS